MKKYIKITPFYAVLCAAIVLGTVIIDLVTKRLIMANMAEGDTIPLIKEVLHLTYITNDGAAFGSFSEHRWVFMTLSTVMLVAITVMILIWDRAKPLFYVSTAMVLGGGIGNMIDRIAYGTVVDFIDFRGFGKLWVWIFNGADSFVCVGAALLMVYYITDMLVTARKETENDGDKAEQADGSTLLIDEKTDGGDEE